MKRYTVRGFLICLPIVLVLLLASGVLLARPAPVAAAHVTHMMPAVPSPEPESYTIYTDDALGTFLVSGDGVNSDPIPVQYFPTDLEQFVPIDANQVGILNFQDGGLYVTFALSTGEMFTIRIVLPPLGQTPYISGVVPAFNSPWVITSEGVLDVSGPLLQNNSNTVDFYANADLQAHDGSPLAMVPTQSQSLDTSQMETGFEMQDGNQLFVTMATDQYGELYVASAAIYSPYPKQYTP